MSALYIFSLISMQKWGRETDCLHKNGGTKVAGLLIAGYNPANASGVSVQSLPWYNNAPRLRAAINLRTQ